MILKKQVSSLVDRPAFSHDKTLTNYSFGSKQETPTIDLDIIIPIYNGLEHLKNCINNLRASKNDLHWHAHLINDASTDPNIAVYLDSLENQSRFSIYTNNQNLGFVKSVNKGFKHTKHDVLLLNSDAIIYDGCLDYLVAHSKNQARVATITPFSNNATIASFPEFCSETNSTLGLEASQLNAICQDVNQGQSVVVPTGVGFCMFISRLAINTVGMFDEANFGRGYGEENDFCVRATQKGFKNLLATDVYVSHVGGQSFGAEKQERVNNAVEKLNKLYPNYNKKIHEFSSLDPVREYRAKLLLKLSNEDKRPVILHICHNHGGGTLKHVRDLSQQLEDKAISWVLRALEGNKIRLEWASAPTTHLDIDVKKDASFFSEILQFIGINRIHVHHIAALPQEVLKFIEHSDIPYDVTLHDYYFIAANPTLSDKNGVYLDHSNQELSSISPLSENELRRWQLEKQAFLQNAERVLCPSEAALAIYQKYYPNLKYQVARHPEWRSEMSYPPVQVKPASNPVNILVVGALTKEKGADLLDEVAKKLGGTEKFKFSLIGYAYRKLHNSIEVSGSYNDNEIDTLIAQKNPDFIWFPASWPETYSFTLSAALRSGKPILAPRLGAFPERLLNRPFSNLYDIPTTTEQALTELHNFAASLVNQAGSYSWSLQAPEDHFYQTDYLRDEIKSLKTVTNETELFDHLKQKIKPRLSLSEKVLGFGLKLKRFPAVRHLINHIPFNYKLRLVKLLTKKNLLDVEAQLAK